MTNNSEHLQTSNTFVSNKSISSFEIQRGILESFNENDNPDNVHIDSTNPIIVHTSQISEDEMFDENSATLYSVNSLRNSFI